jgi:hypothetical protein
MTDWDAFMRMVKRLQSFGVTDVEEMVEVIATISAEEDVPLFTAHDAMVEAPRALLRERVRQVLEAQED